MKKEKKQGRVKLARKVAPVGRKFVEGRGLVETERERVFFENRFERGVEIFVGVW